MICGDASGVIRINTDCSFPREIDMAVPRIVPQDQEPAPVAGSSRPRPVWPYLAVGAALAVVVGTWLVWLSASLERRFQEEDIRAACQRVMPETVDRCVDTVIIQRGGARR
jgi:hypothetical protein